MNDIDKPHKRTIEENQEQLNELSQESSLVQAVHANQIKTLQRYNAELTKQVDRATLLTYICLSLIAILAGFILLVGVSV